MTTAIADIAALPTTDELRHLAKESLRKCGVDVDALLSAVQKRGQHFFDPFRVQQAFLDVVHDHLVEFVHRDRSALAAGRTLACAD